MSLGYTSERRWLRRVDRDFRGLFPCVPRQSGYSNRLRAASSLLTSMIWILARDTSLWHDTEYEETGNRTVRTGPSACRRVRAAG
ncbi:hypothetical protein [Streptomyces sp. NBC_01589]|uniref:hypothetical protein n=1 Tax=unclassified Streptomyces TaxID=2593676 RepID=UPI0038687CFA